MLFTLLLSNPEKPEANEKNKIAAKRSHPEYDAMMKQTAKPTIPTRPNFNHENFTHRQALCYPLW